MKNVGRIAIALCIFAFGVRAHAEPALSGEQLERAMLLSMLLDNDAELSKLSVRSIARQYPTDEALLDFVAERLLQSVSWEAKNKTAGTVEAYAAALRNAHDPRYADILQLARQRYTHEKILATIDVAIANTAIAEGMSRANDKHIAQYVPGQADRVKKQLELTQALLPYKKADNKAFSQVSPGATFREMLEQLGVPDAVSAMPFLVARHWHSDALVAHYAGAGLFIFRFDRGPNSEWNIKEALDEPFAVKESYTGDNFAIAQTIATLRGESFRQYLKLNAGKVKTDESLISILGTRLIEVAFPADRYEAKGNYIALKMIAWSKFPSALDTLQKIAASPGNALPKKARAYILQRERNAAKRLAAGSASAEPADEEDEDEDKEEGESEEAPQ